MLKRIAVNYFNHISHSVLLSFDCYEYVDGIFIKYFKMIMYFCC